MAIRINDGLVGSARLGYQVLHPTSTVPAAQAYNLFTVVTGNVLVTSLVGLVTVQIGAGANVGRMGSDPTVGVIVYWDTGADLNGALVGTMIATTGDVAVAAALGQSVIGEMVQPQVTKPGVITITMAAATAGAGSLSWVLYYIPLEAGAYVVTA